MYVCLCHGVTDTKIRELVDEGACSVADIMVCSKAGTRCGSCRPTIAKVVEEHLAATRAAAQRAGDESGLRHLPLFDRLASAG